MSLRLDKITTKTGDDGTTSLADGSRHLKSSPRFNAIGDVDELNANIGLLRAYLNDASKKVPADPNGEISGLLVIMQHHLFEIGSELAVPGMVFLSANAIDNIESWSHTTNQNLKPLSEFILPSGTLVASQAHICRTVARRVERQLVALNQSEIIHENLITYLNRCSDLFFIMARWFNQNAHQKETYWRGN